LVSKRQIETWAVFAIQILWDTQRELGHTVQIGKDMLAKVGQSMTTRYKRYINTPGLGEISASYKKLSKVVSQRLVAIQQFTLDDVVQQLFDANKRETDCDFKGFENFSLLCHHPGLCGLIIASLQLSYHQFTLDLAGSQSQILTVAHLYNAARQYGLLPDQVDWKDLDWFIDQQDSEWIFAGPAPKKPHEFAARLEVVIGLRTPTAKKRLTDFAVGKNRRFRCMARRAGLSIEQDGLRRSLEVTELHDNVSAMVDALKIDFLKSRKTFRRMSPTNKLVAFRDAVEKDNFPLGFDPLALYLRCLKLLQRIQAHCHENAPIDYARKDFQRGLTMNAIILEMFVNLAGRPTFHESMFPVAVKFLREMIENEGDVEMTGARTQQAESMIVGTQASSDTEPDFENPEDAVPLEIRKWTSRIMVHGKDGNLRMPFN
jgi:hypothetical protein